jgi:hypothetical protein
VLGIVLAASLSAVVFATPPTGAIFTTLPDGSRVNYNIYDIKPHVYLDGGPGDQAPVGSAGLPDGIYVFQVTDPSGKTLLSIDPNGCRRFTVTNGVIVDVAPAGACGHATGIDADHGALSLHPSAPPAVTVQLCGGGVGDPEHPTLCFNDTPNPGGEYKVWVTPIDDFILGCDALDSANTGKELSIVDCGFKSKGNAHGFIPRFSKTDNFKVGSFPREIDGRAHGHDGTILDGWMVVWTDTLGVSNLKWSYEDLSLDVHHEAHVEDVEDGTHTFDLTNQPICTIGQVYVNGQRQPKTGPQTITIKVGPSFGSGTIWYDVYCQ